MLFMQKMPQSTQDYWIAESIKDRAFEDHYDLGKELGRLVTYLSLEWFLFNYHFETLFFGVYILMAMIVNFIQNWLSLQTVHLCLC